MNNIIFTIVAKNYIGLANVLAKSIFEVNDNIDFYVFIADEPDQEITSDFQGVSYKVAKETLNIDEDKWQELSFKYDLTEFCTSIKPACFNYLMDNNPDAKIIYFDPDIAVYNSLNPIFDELENNFLILTPHITTIENYYSGEALENDFLGAGIYNLGFLALRNCKEALTVIEWWHQRLLKQCFIDKFDSIFTDQKWMNFVSCFFDKGVLISRDLGRNIAPWNYFERKVSVEDGIFYVQNRINNSNKTKLLFAHFSGLDYKNLSIQKNKNVPDLRYQDYTDLEDMYQFYKVRLEVGEIKKYFPLIYSYNSYTNGKPIISIHRRLYRRLIEMEVVPNPFDSNNIFYKTLTKSNLLVNSDASSVDKQNHLSIDKFDKKIVLLNHIIIRLEKIIGFKNYILLSKLLIRYFKPENQLFLYDKKYFRNSFRK